MTKNIRYVQLLDMEFVQIMDGYLNETLTNLYGAIS